jgi:Zn-dependent protease
MNIKTSHIEQRDLIKAWLAISAAFAIAMNGLGKGFLTAVLLSGLTVGVGFLLHELAHKFVAQRYGCWAEFRANDQMLFLAVLLSFTGIIFAAPGAVMISGHVTKERNGIISAAGPITNYILAFLFLLVSFVAFTPFLQSLARYGLLINGWLGLFNMIPFGNFDGIKILRWNRTYYGIMVAVGFFILFFQF